MEDIIIMNNFREVKAGSKRLKRYYVAIMMWFMGRAIQAAAAMDKVVKEEFAELPDQFTFALGVMPDGPYMIVGKDRRGFVRYMGWNPEDKKIDLRFTIKNVEAAVLLFTFQESTAVSVARDRLIVDGEVPYGCAVVRILDIVEVYLLPKIIARLAVKRYPVWSPSRKYFGRVLLYFRTVFGF
jgi:aldehyde:ferredoxin oxidoreductase